MTKEEKIMQERQEIEGILMYFAENKLDNSKNKRNVINEK